MGRRNWNDEKQNEREKRFVVSLIVAIISIGIFLAIKGYIN